MIETSSVLPRKSSANFGNLRKMFGDVRQAFGTVLENLRKSSESGRKSSESRQKHCYQYVYIINRILHGRLEIWNLSSRVHIQYLTRLLRSLVRYQCEHSARPCIILYLIYKLKKRIVQEFSQFTTKTEELFCFGYVVVQFYLWYNLFLNQYKLF